MRYRRGGLEVKIGIDVDGVLLDYEKELLVRAEIFDMEKCRGNGKVHLDEYFIQNKYDWTAEEKSQFIDENLERISKEAKLMSGAKYVLQKLKEMGDELIILSSRGAEGDELIKIAVQKFQEQNLIFDKYYWKEKNKLKICQEEKIDIMIDDSSVTCQKLADHQIKTLYFRGIRGWDLEENEYLKEVSNWGEVYRYRKG